jgi:hypothetical protein
MIHLHGERMRVGVVAFAMTLACGACAAASSSAVAPDPGPLRQEAAAALQGGVPDLFFQEEDLAAVAEAIAALRARFPDVGDIRASQYPLTLALTDSAWHQFAARFPDPQGNTLQTITGIPGVDSVNAALGARGVLVEGGFQLAPVFDRPANVPAIAPLYGRLLEVEYAGPELQVGGGSGMLARLRDDEVDLHLTRGWGDCPSGCIYHRAYVFRYDRRTRRIVQVSDSGDQTPTSGLEEWLRRPDWAKFDRRSEVVRRAYAHALAQDPRTAIGILRGLAPRLRALDDFHHSTTLLARNDVRSDRLLVSHLAALPGDAGRQARQVLFDVHGLALAGDRRAPVFALKALLQEYTHRAPPPVELSRRLVRNPVVLADHEMLLHLIREIHPHEELRLEACRRYLERRYPVWARSFMPDGPWYSLLSCPGLPPPPS